jgi:hypothetical protein
VTYETVSCLGCRRVHLVNPKNGRVLGSVHGPDPNATRGIPWFRRVLGTGGGLVLRIGAKPKGSPGS